MLLALTRAPALIRVLGPCLYGGARDSPAVPREPAGGRRGSGSTLLAACLAPTQGEQIPTLAPLVSLPRDGSRGSTRTGYRPAHPPEAVSVSVPVPVPVATAWGVLSDSASDRGPSSLQHPQPAESR